MARTNFSYGTIRPQVINAIFDSSSPFTVNEVAESRGLLYKSVKRVIDQLVEEGYITKTPAALKPIRPDGKFDRGRPKDAYNLVANHERIKELRISVPRDNLPFVEGEESIEPTSFYYDRVKNAIDLMEKSNKITAKSIKSIGADLELATKEESLSQEKLSPLKKAFLQYQKGRLNYAKGSINSALKDFISSALTFKKFSVTDMIPQCSYNIIRCQIDLFEEYSNKIADITEDQNLLANYFEEAKKACFLNLGAVQESKSEEPIERIQAIEDIVLNDFSTPILGEYEPIGNLKFSEQPQFIRTGDVTMLCMGKERIYELVENIHKTKKQMENIERSLFAVKKAFKLFFHNAVPNAFVHRFKR